MTADLGSRPDTQDARGRHAAVRSVPTPPARSQDPAHSADPAAHHGSGRSRGQRSARRRRVAVSHDRTELLDLRALRDPAAGHPAAGDPPVDTAPARDAPARPAALRPSPVPRPTPFPRGAAVVAPTTTPAVDDAVVGLELLEAGPQAPAPTVAATHEAGTGAHHAGGSRSRERTALYVLIGVIAVVVLGIKLYSLVDIVDQPVLRTYGLVITAFIFSRFVLAWLYTPQLPVVLEHDLPTVALIVPAYNEEAEIAATVAACLDIDYPAHLVRVVVVDDRSSDGTLASIRGLERQRRASGALAPGGTPRPGTSGGHVLTAPVTRPELVVVEHAENAGKRVAMASGIDEAGDAEILVFIDSDSRLEPDSVVRMMRYFVDEKVGAVCGHTDVMNRGTNYLTKMQAVRYFVAFRIIKSAEALFGSVTCCSGCFSAYRRTAVDPVVDGWRTQRFLGEPATFGDDRSLTNLMLRDWRVLYAPDAQAHTNVPDSMKVFLRQQLRWKKSWSRESLRASRFMWRKHPIMAVSFYLGFVLPLLAPLIVGRALWLLTDAGNPAPLWFLGGVVVMALIYSLYFLVHRRERMWGYGVVFALFYAFVLVWQLPYAILTIRNSKWGTR